MLGASKLSSVFEKRDVDPEASFFRRRYGSSRLTNAVPNLLGVTADIDMGTAVVDYAFASETSNWTIFGTLHTPLTDEDSSAPIFQFRGLHVYVNYTFSSHTVALAVYTAAGVLKASHALGDIDGAGGTDYRFGIRYEASSGKVFIATWTAPTVGGSAGTPSESTGITATLVGGSFSFIGEMLEAGAFPQPAYSGVVLTNALLYNVSTFSLPNEYEDLASDLTPALTISPDAGGTARLIYHEKFTEGGDVLVFTNYFDVSVYTYLIPTLPVDGARGEEDVDWIHFGGKGVVEIPFYLDFDEYYWTPITGTARVDWVFALEVTLPKVLAVGTIFEFQDILRLDVIEDGGDYFIKGTFSGTGVTTSTLALIAGTRYEIFAGRDIDSSQIKVVNVVADTSTETAGTVDNPALFNYDKTLGFIIGDKIDQENSAPFGGQIRRIALYNETTRKWFPIKEAVFYYDINSLSGDQIIDRGNRVLNAFCGTRMPSAAPFYSQGGFSGGSYIAAVSGYTMAVSTPDISYSGELKRSITEDAVVQRRGSKSFLTTNGINYLVDDFSKTFRPLGIPRPATKVSCTPQGVGVIDGFVRYAYRWVTKDGTVGPSFPLDPVDAQGGVNVFVGAEGFGPPGETPFGISFGECEGYKDDEDKGKVSEDSVETFIVKDSDGGSNHNILSKSITNPGLTLETAVRIPGIDEVKESIFSQGVYAPSGVDEWGSDEVPYMFPWIGASNQECCFQFAFRFDSSVNYQTLFGIGTRDQLYDTGGFPHSNHHYKLNHLVVSIQPALDVAANTYSIVVCRDAPSGSHHRDNDLHHEAFDYEFLDNNDYSVFIRRAGSLIGSNEGSDLVIHIYNHTLDGTSDGGGGLYDGWALWPTAGDTQTTQPGFWGDGYNGDANDEVMWGFSRHEGGGQHRVKTRKRNAIVPSIFDFAYINAFAGGTAAGPPEVPGGILYHGRMWRQDFPVQVLAVKALSRYGAREGPLKENLEVDIAFSPDSSVRTIDGGYDYTQSLRAKFYAQGAGAINGKVFLGVTDSSPILAYGYDMEYSGSGPHVWNTTSLDQVPMWVTWSSRNEGSLVIGVGNLPQIEVATKKWHTDSGVKTFDEFANTIDLKQWTWITLYYHHLVRPASVNDYIDVWLERVFIDGNTGEWGETFWADMTLNGIWPNSAASVPAVVKYGLYTCGGLPGLDQKYDVEIAETRLWAGQRYTAEGGGGGDTAFGPYMSNRLPPNIWDELWYYLRYMKTDTDDEDNQTTMSQFGLYRTTEDPGSEETPVGQETALSVEIFQTAVVKDALDDDTGTSFYIPFPDPPMSAIRGIQIFRSQVVPVTNTFPTGDANPNAIPEAWRACRDAPLYYVSEIPRGTTSFLDTADDTALGPQLDAQTGLIPRNPRGVFEWQGFIGVFVDDQPRIHFAESPTSWESFPLDMVYDLPVREYGPIEAAQELASRDARQSRVLCLGKSWGVFIDGSPTAPIANTLGGGVGAFSPRCLVVEKGIAYAYNGTLWGITGDGQIEDLGLPVLDLLPDPAVARLSVSSALSSLFVINETTGLALRFHLARRQWFVEDRYATSVTDVDGVDTWVHVSGYPSEGNPDIYQDDVESNTPEDGIAVTEYSNGADTFTVAANTGLKIGQRGVLVADGGDAGENNPVFRQAVIIKTIASTVITIEGDLDLTSSWTPLGDSTPIDLTYTFYAGVGYWGAMIDTGQFNLNGDLNHVDVGIERGDGWWAAFDSSDFAKDPADRTGFSSSESQPTNIVDVAGGGTSARWGLSNRQRLERVLIYSQKPTDGSRSPVGLTELELSYDRDPKEL